MSTITKDQVIDWLTQQGPGEIGSLVSELEGKWGIKAPVRQAAVEPIHVVTKAVEVPTSFNVLLKTVSDATKKVAVMKELRTIIPSVGLADIKKIVDSAPGRIKDGVSETEASEIKAKLEPLSAIIEIIPV